MSSRTTETRNHQNGQSPTAGVSRRPHSKPESLGSKDSEYVSTIVKPDRIHEKWEQWLETEFSRDYPLANFPYGHAEREELLLQNRMDLFRGSHPPDESAMQGEVRNALIGDKKEPLDANDHFQLQSYLRRIVARIRRGERGWQQDKFDGVLSVSRSENGNKRSLKEKIFG